MRFAPSGYPTLPALLAETELCEEDRLLRHNVIKDGGTAMIAYARMQFGEMTDAEVQAIRAALLNYCELDTLAMVMTFEHFRDAVAAAYEKVRYEKA